MPVEQVNIPSLGGWHLAMHAKRTLRWDQAGALHVTVGEGTVDDQEDTAWKPLTDVVVQGHIYSTTGRETIGGCDVEGREHRIRAVGDRVIQAVHGDRCEFSAPVEFERIPLVWERAYGGLDGNASAAAGEFDGRESEVLRARLHMLSDFAYPRNPVGCGFLMRSSGNRVLGQSVPNLDDPDDPVLEETLLRASPDDWPTAPFPACWDWKALNTFPRSLLLGESAPLVGPGLRLREIALGALTERDLVPSGSETLGPMSLLPMGLLTEPRALLGAAPGLATRRLVGGEALRLTNLEPGRAERILTLPRDAPVMRIKPPGCDWFDLESLLDTVVVRPDEQELRLTYHCKLRVAGRYPENELALARGESRVFGP